MTDMRTAMRTHAAGSCGRATPERTWRSAAGSRTGGITAASRSSTCATAKVSVQLVFHPEGAPEAHAAAQSLGAEDVVRVTGVVRLRPEGMVNPALETGEVEVAAGTLEVLSESDTPPFPIEDRIEAGEELRLKYRYLDLRRPEMTTVLRLRHTINRLMREHMDALGFVEVETPLLTRSTPEGARDFLVPSRTGRARSTPSRSRRSS